MKAGFATLIAVLFSSELFAHADHGTKAALSFSAVDHSARVATGTLKVVPGRITNFRNQEELRRLNAAFEAIETVINSETFKQKVVNFVGSDGKRQYMASNNLTNEQVYEFLMQGRELINGARTLGEMNFDVNRYHRAWSRVIGYTNPGRSNLISVNGRFYSWYGVAEMAGNITHEWIHLKGFYHASARDHDSVPYAVGYIMEDLVKQYLRDGHIQ
jgi:hypothetical protein